MNVRAACLTCINIGTETDFRAKRSVFLGTTVASFFRRHRHHGKGKGSPQAGGAPEKEDKIQAPAERIHFLLGEEDEAHESHPLFSEMELLTQSQETGDYEWREAARWIKFEEVSAQIRSDRAIMKALVLSLS